MEEENTNKTPQIDLNSAMIEFADYIPSKKRRKGSGKFASFKLMEKNTAKVIYGGNIYNDASSFRKLLVAEGMSPIEAKLAYVFIGKEEAEAHLNSKHVTGDEPVILPAKTYVIRRDA